MNSVPVLVATALSLAGFVGYAPLQLIGEKAKGAMTFEALNKKIRSLLGK